MASRCSGLLGTDKQDKPENSYFNGLLIAFRFGFIHLEKYGPMVPRMLVSALTLIAAAYLVNEVPIRAVTCAEKAHERPDPVVAALQGFPSTTGL